MSTKIYLLMCQTFSDFDMPYDTPILASTDKHKITLACAERNANLTKQEIDDETSYHVSDGIKTI